MSSPLAADPAVQADPAGDPRMSPLAAGPVEGIDFERPESISAIAKRLIRTKIVTGELDEPRIYSVPVLAAALGVSATPVREAMRELAVEGLVEVVPNRGFRVVDVSKHDLDEIFELRLMLEVPAAGRIAELADERSLAPCLVLERRTEEFARRGDVGALPRRRPGVPPRVPLAARQPPARRDRRAAAEPGTAPRHPLARAARPARGIGARAPPPDRRRARPRRGPGGRGDAAAYRAHPWHLGRRGGAVSRGRRQRR